MLERATNAADAFVVRRADHGIGSEALRHGTLPADIHGVLQERQLVGQACEVIDDPCDQHFVDRRADTGERTDNGLCQLRARKARQ